MIGQRFGRLVIVAEMPRNKHGHREWQCLCDCGNRSVVAQTELTRINRTPTRSCGCYGRERSTTHNKSKTLEYSAWNMMLSRCQNPKNKSYPNYGGRGITVCNRWLLFVNFFEDMGTRPCGLQLDRIDNNAGYSPDNCRWATPKQNASNRRSNKPVTIGGETRIMSEWVESGKVSNRAFYRRVAAGWDPEKALYTPTQPSKKGCKDAINI